MSVHITVGTDDLRRALRAVTPHASTDKASTAYRVRLTADRTNLTVTATNRTSYAHALVSVLDGDGERQPTDITPQEAKEIIALFPAAPDSSDENPGEQLRLDIDDEHLTITDAGGFLDGKSVTFPRTPTDPNFTDAATLIGKLLSRPTAKQRPTEYLLDGATVALFAHPAKVYGELLAIEPGKPTVIRCGDSFIGAVMHGVVDSDKQAQLAEWRTDWTERLQAAIS
jgi:hypothetical protein